MRVLAGLTILSLATAPAWAYAQDAASPLLPVGDGRITTEPRVGNIFACETAFRGGGALQTGAWFHGDTWDPLEKPRVEGRVMWPDAAFSTTDQGEAVVVKGNGLPMGQPTGSFPITPDQSVYQYDPNPNRIVAQDMNFQIPAVPIKAGSPQCLPMGMIGFSITGVALYNALDAAGRDAAAHEIQDLCDGHPQGRGQYHYHSASTCIPGTEENAVIGWALDGFPILGGQDAQGRTLTNADLDACHGRDEVVTVAGRSYGYAYRVTREYPYILGCFTGTLMETTQADIRQGLAPPQRNRGSGQAGRRPSQN